ncbi:MAG: phage portal protein [Cloacibacillus sp.]
MALDVTLGYDGASRTRRLSGWRKVTAASANSEARPVIRALRERTRDLARNNYYGVRAIDQIANNMVGAGIIPVFKAKSKAKADRLNELWTAWGEDSVYCDFDEVGNIYALQGMMAKTLAESGECVVLRRFVNDSSRVLPFEIQVLEPDHIDSTRDSYHRLVGEPFTCLGIQFNALGKRTGYWLFDNHPGEGVAMNASRLHSADEVIHLFRRDRPEQIRGIPWLTPCILRMKDLDDYEDAQLLRQKIAACFAAFIRDTEGGGSISGDDDELLERIEPGRIETLPPGKDIVFGSPPGPENYDAYMRQVLHGIAAGVGLTYEMLTGDYSQVNFTSGRMGRGDFWTQLDCWQWHIFIPQALSVLGRWFLEAAELKGCDISGVRIEWVPPKRQLVDPTREIPAMVKSVRAGFSSRQQQIRELGFDPRVVEGELEEDNANADAKGLILDSDPRRVNNGGQAQADMTGGGAEENNNKEDE